MNILQLGGGVKLHGPSVVCLGFFDGVHLGHTRLITRALEVARAKAWLSCVHTFDQMPARVLRPGQVVLELTPLPEKAALIEGLDVDVLAVSPFAETMGMPARDFFFSILIDALEARHIIAGFHHHFGYRGEGNTETLAAFCREAGIGLDIIQPVTLNGGELISSTAIREAVASGDLKRAEAMLGRPWHGGKGT